MKNFHVILISHGPMAEATLESSKMIIGEVSNLSAVVLNSHEGPEDFIFKLKNTIDLCEVKKVIILADIAGGTPFNSAFKLAFEGICHAIIPGFSLPLLIQLQTMYESAEDLNFIDELLEEVKNSMYETLSNKKNNFDEEDE